LLRVFTVSHVVDPRAAAKGGNVFSDVITANFGNVVRRRLGTAQNQKETGAGRVR
jgi:hypothetical protein